MSESETASARSTAASRMAWVGVGTLTLALNLPPGRIVLLAIGIPWIIVSFLLARRATADRVLAAWRGAVGSTAGAVGLAGLGVVVVWVAVAVAASAAALLVVWLAAVGSLIGALRRPPRLSEYLAGSAMLAASTGLMILLAEAVLRLDAVAERLGAPAEINAWAQRYDSVLAWNMLGIRSPYETLRKADGVVRIVAIGDSFTWGDKIASSDSLWPAQLEAELRQRDGGTPFEVVNLGQLGFTGVNNAEMLRRLGWQFDPDIVVVQFYLNDILPGAANFKRRDSGWLLPRVRILPERYRRGRVRTSALLHVTEGALTGLRRGDRAVQAATWTAVYERRGREWDALAAALMEIGNAAAEREVPIILLLFPDFIPGLEEGMEPPFAAIHEQVIDVARSAGFSILDLTHHYLREGSDLRRWWATRYDTHPGPAAAALAARVLADHLIETVDLTTWQAPRPAGAGR